MYDDAAKMERALLLDVSSPAVTAKGNIYKKADMLLTFHPKAVVIVVSGSEIAWKCGEPPRHLRTYAQPWGLLNAKGKARDFASVSWSRCSSFRHQQPGCCPHPCQ